MSPSTAWPLFPSIELRHPEAGANQRQDTLRFTGESLQLVLPSRMTEITTILLALLGGSTGFAVVFLRPAGGAAQLVREEPRDKR